MLESPSSLEPGCGSAVIVLLLQLLNFVTLLVLRFEIVSSSDLLSSSSDCISSHLLSGVSFMTFLMTFSLGQHLFFYIHG